MFCFLINPGCSWSFTTSNRFTYQYHGQVREICISFVSVKTKVSVALKEYKVLIQWMSEDHPWAAIPKLLFRLSPSSFPKPACPQHSECRPVLNARAERDMFFENIHSERLQPSITGILKGLEQPGIVCNVAHCFSGKSSIRV